MALAKRVALGAPPRAVAEAEAALVQGLIVRRMQGVRMAAGTANFGAAATLSLFDFALVKIEVRVSPSIADRRVKVSENVASSCASWCPIRTMLRSSPDGSRRTYPPHDAVCRYRLARLHDGQVTVDPVNRSVRLRVSR
jgi:hypothetical protein